MVFPCRLPEREAPAYRHLAWSRPHCSSSSVEEVPAGALRARDKRDDMSESEEVLYVHKAINRPQQTRPWNVKGPAAGRATVAVVACQCQKSGGLS